MPGVVFLIVVPTANFERELYYGTTNQELSTQNLPVHNIVTKPGLGGGGGGGGTGGGNNNLNINLPENNNAILRLEVELRDKHAPKYRRAAGIGMPSAPAIGYGVKGRGGGVSRPGGHNRPHGEGGGGGSGVGAITTVMTDLKGNAIIPLEKVLEELLVKLDIEHVTWTTSKKGYFHHVVFPLQSGEPCETTLHCLTELGIGTKLNSSVSVLPCSVSYDALTVVEDESDAMDGEELSRWNNFVESIKSKLTVKQVVDGVRAGGSLSFDYLLLIVTADSLAALGLVENNAPNITAAMLVSPLMGPVMSITFGAIISDRELIRVGFISLALGMFISCLFGFIFGLILGTTEMPWGSGDWPTEEMRGRGNVRSLWMGVLWALTSGTGVAVALLQGSAGPLIGVAISASLLPPVVNCGLFWALACIWLIYPGTRIPHIKGERLNETSQYPFLYTDYLPTEFLINGIVSCLLTVVNVICIFITAIIVLKIKEVSAPYTASPDLKRFWETDLRTVRKTNRSTMRQRRGGGGGGPGSGGTGTFRDKLLSGYQGLEEHRSPEMDSVLEQALKEAEDDVTFKKVKRMSYSSNAAGELTQRLAKLAGLNKQPTDLSGLGLSGTSNGSHAGSRMNSIRGSKMKIDLKVLDKLVTNLLEQQTPDQDHSNSSGGVGSSTIYASTPAKNRKASMKLNRWRPTSRSAHSFNITENSSNFNTEHASNTTSSAGGGAGGGSGGNSGSGDMQYMPTIMESSTTSPMAKNNNERGASRTSQRSSWSSSLDRTPGAVRNVLRNISAATVQSGGSSDAGNEENLNLTKNFVA
ncbi:uncharacterized protein LOC142223482 [Haematobia irritans]|uniref:uncharacterized protein LOC142223482 n=1 Tax=Haematobia irritans TaxID=7368 RepID=UPI003F4F5D90